MPTEHFVAFTSSGPLESTLTIFADFFATSYETDANDQTELHGEEGESACDQIWQYEQPASWRHADRSVQPSEFQFQI